jgi:hypothetical protein
LLLLPCSQGTCRFPDSPEIYTGKVTAVEIGNYPLKKTVAERVVFYFDPEKVPVLGLLTPFAHIEA